MSLFDIFRLKKQTIALALGAGGARGLAHIGVIKALEEVGFKPDLIVGSSMGAFIGSFYAFGYSSDEMKDIYKKALVKFAGNIVKLNIKFDSIIDSSIIRDVLMDYFKDTKIEEAKIKLGIVASDISSKKEVLFTNGNLINAVQASAAIPFVFPAVRLKGMKLVDGGVIEPVPVRAARFMGAEKIIGVNVMKRRYPEIKKTHMPWSLPRDKFSLSELISDNIFSNLLSTLQLLQDARLPYENSQDAYVFDVALEEVHTLDFEKGDRCIEYGYKKTKQFLKDTPTFFR